MIYYKQHNVPFRRLNTCLNRSLCMLRTSSSWRNACGGYVTMSLTIAWLCATTSQVRLVGEIRSLKRAFGLCAS